LSARPVNGYADQPGGDDPRSGSWTRVSPQGDGFAGGPTLLDRARIQEPQPSWGYTDDGSWVGAAGEASAGSEWWDGAAPARNADWASPAPSPEVEAADEPPSTRNKAAKIAIGVGVVTALLVAGVVAFAGTILIGGVGGGGTGGAEAGGKVTVANGDHTGAPVLPGASDPAGGYPDAPTSAPTTPAADATTHAPTKAPTTKAPVAPGGALANPVQEGAVLGLVNKVRGENGCRSLSFAAKLADAARKHSQDMATRRYFSHDTPEGVSMADRINAEGYKWTMLGENIAEGQKDANAVMTAWMNSPGHRANILNCKYTQIGIGLAYQGKTPVWTQDFGTPQ
jgi:uncharacterized protein YkwD